MNSYEDLLNRAKELDEVMLRENKITYRERHLNRNLAFVDLRKSGLTYAEIAKLAKLNPERIRKSVNRLYNFENVVFCVKCCNKMDLLNDYDIVASLGNGEKRKIKVDLYKCVRCNQKHMTTNQLREAKEKML